MAVGVRGGDMSYVAHAFEVWPEMELICDVILGI